MQARQHKTEFHASVEQHQILTNKISKLRCDLKHIKFIKSHKINKNKIINQYAKQCRRETKTAKEEKIFSDEINFIENKNKVNIIRREIFDGEIKIREKRQKCIESSATNTRTQEEKNYKIILLNNKLNKEYNIILHDLIYNYMVGLRREKIKEFKEQKIKKVLKEKEEENNKMIKLKNEYNNKAAVLIIKQAMMMREIILASRVRNNNNINRKINNNNKNKNNNNNNN
eukprot:Tbor_TRINITY_DN5616_c4_g2::TRINITY_DN5616_c4_g2_i7::g.9387::m.9387